MKIKKGFMKRKIGDKYLVVTVGEQQQTESIFIELNETSSDVWDWLEAGCEEAELVEKLCDKYAVSPEKAAADVKNLLAAMQDAGVLVD